MPLDTSIPLGVRPVQVEDPMQSQVKQLQLKSLMMQNRQAEEAMANDKALSEAYRGSVGADGKLDRGGLFGNLAQQGLGKQIPGLQKQFAEADHAQTTQQGAQFDLAKKKLDASGASLQSLLSMPPDQLNHDVIINSVAQLVQNGLMDQAQGAQLVRSLPGNPQALRPFLLQKGLAVQSAKDQLAALMPKTGTIDGGNRVLTTNTNPMTGEVTTTGQIQKAPEGYILGPDGKMTIDPGFLRGKTTIAAAGANKTSVNVNTVKPLMQTMAEGLGKQLDDGLSGAQAASSTIQSAQSLKKLLASGDVITGTGADTRVFLTRLGETLGVGGNNASEKLAATSAAVQELAKAELQASQSMKGQGAITEGERAIIKRAASGDLNMSKAELMTLANGLEKNARGRITNHQANVERLKAIPDAAPLIPFYNGVQVPPEMGATSPSAPGAAPAALPQGWSVQAH